MLHILLFFHNPLPSAPPSPVKKRQFSASGGSPKCVTSTWQPRRGWFNCLKAALVCIFLGVYLQLTSNHKYSCLFGGSIHVLSERNSALSGQSQFKFPGCTCAPIFVATNEPSIPWVYKMISWKFVWSTFWVVRVIRGFLQNDLVFLQGQQGQHGEQRPNTTSCLNPRVHLVDFSNSR